MPDNRFTDCRNVFLAPERADRTVSMSPLSVALDRPKTFMFVELFHLHGKYGGRIGKLQRLRRVGLQKHRGSDTGNDHNGNYPERGLFIIQDIPYPPLCSAFTEGQRTARENGPSRGKP